MHPEAWHWLDAQIRPLLAGAARVVDLGGRNVNGSPRALFGAATHYSVVDVRAGEGVDIVADAGAWAEAVRVVDFPAGALTLHGDAERQQVAVTLAPTVTP